MATLLEAHQLRKTYTLGKDNKIDVLNGIDLKIDEGEFVAIMGPSGSGKSTLLHTISGLDKATSGYVSFEGKTLSSLTEKELSLLRASRMGFVFQGAQLLGNLSIFDNIILTAYHAGKVSWRKVNAQAEALLSRFGLSDLKNNDISQASGGQLQRVSICRALMNNPAVIFGDEPTGALNSKATDSVLSLFDSINENGTTVVIVTHDIKVAARAHRILYMLDGKIVAEKLLGQQEHNEHARNHRNEALNDWLTSYSF